jgi:hypothetical protein
MSFRLSDSTLRELNREGPSMADDLIAEWFPRAKSELTVCGTSNGEFVIACPSKPLSETEARSILTAYETFRQEIEEGLA